MSIIDAYHKIVQVPLHNLFTIFHIHVRPEIIDIIVLWVAIGGLTFRTATTINRQAFLSSETGFTTWLERRINEINLMKELTYSFKSEENGKKMCFLVR